MRTNREQPINKKRLANYSIVELIKDLADAYYTHPEDRITLGSWTDWLNACAVNYDISRDDLHKFGYERALVLYASQLLYQDEIADWDWNANRNIMYLKQKEE